MLDKEKLNKIIEEATEMSHMYITARDVKFQAWFEKSSRFLITKFGQSSYEYDSFRKTAFSPQVFTPRTPEETFIDALHLGLQKSILIFKDYLKEMDDQPVAQKPILSDKSKIFIVHGHDGELKESVARLIEHQGIQAIILFEKPNQGKTLIEKFESYSNVGSAICLFTKDDLGKAKNESEEKYRARQNVVLETGYFMGKLGRNNIVILADSGIEMPSDLSGVVYTNTANWQFELLKELKFFGYNIDFNRLF